jgi:hypothetical protein
MYEKKGDSIMQEIDWTWQIVQEVYDAVNIVNEHFWPALLVPDDNLIAKPDRWVVGSKEEMQIKLQECYNAWTETPEAIKIIGVIPGMGPWKPLDIAYPNWRGLAAREFT